MNPDVAIVINAVAVYVGMTASGIRLGRSAKVVEARWICWAILASMGWTHDAIGKEFGRDHSTVTHGLSEAPVLIEGLAQIVHDLQPRRTAKAAPAHVERGLGDRSDIQRDLRRAWSESDFTEEVVALAQERGWEACHFRPCRTAHGWVTAVQGDKGFVDVVAARAGVVHHWELKRHGNNRLEEGQPEWGAALGASYRLFHPDDWGEIERMLL